MPILTIPKSIYPVVPQALGVPPLLRAGAQILDTITLGYLGVGSALDNLIGADPARWGVFDSGGRVFAEYDSVFATGYRNESRVSDYPVERGSFAVYNKVDGPFEIEVTLNCGGSEAVRSQFIADIERARKSLDLFTVVTPEYTYENVNFTRLAIERSATNGAHLIIAQLGGQEIRERNSAAYSQSKSIAGFDMQEQGQVQIIADPSLDASGLV